MAGWYSVGTVTVTNGSTVVTGAGTDFVNNVSARDAFCLIGGNPNEIASIQSATQMTLARPWLGASAAGQAYVVIPTVGIYVDLALRALNMLTPFQAMIDGIGQGLVSSGTNAAPGIRFSADQDTGFRRAAENSLSIVTGGIDRIVADVNGATIYGPSANVIAPELPQLIVTRSGVGSWKMGGLATGSSVWALQFNASTFVQCDTTGKVSIGTGNGAAAALLMVSANATTGRSISATGTINANGADYAEYMTKAESCGPIAAGDVCGVDISGKLTRTWSAASSFVVKSTNPSVVGGDIWSAHIGPVPEQPLEPSAPGLAPMPPETNDPEILAQWQGEVDEHAALVAAYPISHAKWAAAQADYNAALTRWEAEFEAARQCVDRVAFCGQVPVNVTGDFDVGDYIVASANGAGIKAVAIAEPDITFDQYRRRIGKVWAVREGRAWVDVQHG